MAGRASQRTDENADIIIREIEIGGTRVSACMVAGMSTDTLNRWEKTDAVFALRLKRAEGIRNRSLILGMRTKGADDWRMYAWLLERVAKEEFGTAKIDVNLTVRQINERAERIAAALGMTVEEVIAEAESIVSGAVRP